MRRENVNVAEILQRQAARLGKKPAIVHGERSISYARLARNVRRRAGLFRRNGVRPGDAVLVVVPISIELYEIMIALFHAGAIALFLDAWSDRSRIELARRSMPVTGFIAPFRARLLRLISPSLRSIPHSFSLHPLPGSAEMREPEHLEGDAPALVTFTTGSTGTPRGANRTHRHLREQQQAIIDTFSPREDDVDLATLPIFPLSNLAVGSTTVLPRIDFRHPAAFDPDGVMRTFARHDVTTAALSPAVVERLLESRQADALPHLRRLLVGGSSVTPELAGRVRERFAETELLAVYGSTEAEPISVIDFDTLAESVSDDWRTGLPAGWPIDRISLRIIAVDAGSDDAATEVPPGMPGEICVTGPHVLKQYTGPRSEWGSKYVEIDGDAWLRTGDAGVLMPDGSLRLLGRVAAGIQFENDGEPDILWPFAAERLLCGRPGIACGTAVRSGSSVIWVIEPLSNARSEGDDIRADLGEELRLLGLPVTEVRILERIPRDPRHASKFDYGKLADELSR